MPFSYSLYDVLRNAGFSDAEIPTMTAIANAESSLRPDAHNSNASTRDDSYGLWQINLYGSLRSRLQSWGLTSPSQLFDPVINAQAAKHVYDSQGFSAWSVYKSGAYRQYLSAAQPNGTLDAKAQVVTTNTEIPGAKQLGSNTAGSAGKPGAWTDKDGKPIGDPPVGVTYSGGKPKFTVTADQAKQTWTDANWRTVIGWLTQYNGGNGSWTKNENFDPGKLSDNDKGFIFNVYLNTVRSQPKGAVAIPDPGEAIPLEPADAIKALANKLDDFIGMFTGLFSGARKIFEYLSKAENWKRIGLGALGAIILAFVGFKMFGGDVSSVATTVATRGMVKGKGAKAV